MEKILLFDVPEKMIMDPVHGAIHIFDYEKATIDHPLFQRLKYILQNDVVFMVFPGCSHNRFSHSLGTMNIAGRYFRKLTLEYLKRSNSQELTAVQFRSITYIYRCIRLAALLHDTGHSPFSHQFELIDRINEIYEDTEFIKTIFKDCDYTDWFGQLPTRIKHEHFSVRSAHFILSGIKTLPVDVMDVLYFLEGTKIKMSDKLEHHGNAFVSILFGSNWSDSLDTAHITPEKVLSDFYNLLKNIITGELDADKMDYILRDSYYSGCNYGKYNLDHLLNNIRAGYQWVIGDDKKLINLRLSIAIHEKGLGALEDFIYARFQLYQELYNHKSVSGFRKLLSLAIAEVMKTAEEKIKKYLSDIDHFAQFSDTFFWEEFRRFALSNGPSYSLRLVNRKRLEYMGKLENMNLDVVNFECQKRSQAINKQIVYWKSKIKFSSIDEFYNDIKVLTKTMEGRQELKGIAQVTDFFDKFKKEEIYHLFILEDN